jgi:bifunctional UDP-N-acetylglucosamine pyrophosphorylase/glucosamine-1-phosphate N-acetyltransferase
MGWSRRGKRGKMDIVTVVLAAGEGKRMKSAKPKVVHGLLGKPLIRWVIDAVHDAGCEDVISVIGHGREQVAPFVADTQAVVQEQQRGTGHAVQCARSYLEGHDGSLLVLSGDSPLITPTTIRQLVERREKTRAAAVVLTMMPPDPSGYGRIIRDSTSQVAAIVEDKDCSPEQRGVGECNSGIYCFDIKVLLSHLDELSCDNAQGEYYLTDIIGIYADAGLRVEGLPACDYTEALGINSRVQLAQATSLLQQRINTHFMDEGVTMVDPHLVWIGPDVTIEPDVELRPMTFIEGESHIASGTVIGPNSRLFDCRVGHDCEVEETVARSAVLDNRVTCGPRAYLRPGAHLCDDSKAGTHVEIKKSTIGVGSKVPHLSYIGDTIMGANVNIGAGTITCNYDGVRKNHTTIGDDCFVGSDTMLVAPVNVGSGVVIGAGSTITKDVPSDALALERNEQTIIEGWAARKREKDEIDKRNQGTR